MLSEREEAWTDVRDGLAMVNAALADVTDALDRIANYSASNAEMAFAASVGAIARCCRKAEYHAAAFRYIDE